MRGAFGHLFFMLIFSRLPRLSWQQVSLLLVVVAAFLLSHPFTGIRHDGILYAGEALARILPSEFTDDTYFRYGSQGRFTLLPAFYTVLIANFGVGGGTIVGLLLAFVLYLAASTLLIATIAPRKLWLPCVLSVLLGWTIYGGLRIFSYSEPFLTARSFAEPAVLVALALLLRHRTVAAAVAMLIALAMHPLIATSGVLVAWLWLVQQDRRWLICGVVSILALCILGAAQVGPFADLLTRYDATWLALVQEDNPQAFVLHWSLLDYGVMVFNVAVLWFAAQFAPNRMQRQFVVAVIAAGLGATLFSLVVVDIALNPFFGKLQIWRAEWLMQWIAMASFPVVCLGLWKRGDQSRIAACFLTLGWMAPFTAAPAFLGAMAVLSDTFRKRFTVSKATPRIVVAVVAITYVILVVQHETRAWTLGRLLDQGPLQIAAQALGLNLVLLPIVFVFTRWLSRMGPVAPAVAVAMFVGSLLLWDQRTPWTKTLESYVPGKPIWADLIEPQAKVFWYRNLIAPWILLGHSNYYTAQQGSGAVFSRDMTIELDRRDKVTGLLDLQEQICRLMNNLNERQSSCEPDAATVREVCTSGGIDYVVLQSRLTGMMPLADLSTGVIENGYEKRFFLYRCSVL